MDWLSEFGGILMMQGFNGLSVFCVLLLMALGLAIIFGQMGVINMAHGEFLIIGAYSTYLLSKLTTDYAPALQPYYFFGAIALAFLVAYFVGYWVERLMISHLYKRPLDTLLATWGLSLIMQQVFRSTFGPKEVTATLPDWLMGSVQPFEGVDIPLGETSESYAVEILSGSEVKRLVSCPTTSLFYESVQEIADFGQPQTVLRLRIAQVSAAVGRGFALQADVPVL